MEKRRWYVVFSVFCVVMLLVSPGYADEHSEAAEYQVNCNPHHHTAAPFLSQMMGNDNARLYANMAQTVIVAMKIAECGNRWFFAIYHNGKFRSNYFPADGWQYIAKQIRDLGLSVIPWRNVVVQSVTSITVLSVGILFPTPLFLPWIRIERLYNIPNPTVSAAEYVAPVPSDGTPSPIATPQP